MLVDARVDDGQPPGFCIAESDVKIFGRWVVTNVVGVRANRQTIYEFERVSRKNFAGTVGSIGYIEPLEVRGIEQPLWLALSWDAGFPLP